MRAIPTSREIVLRTLKTLKKIGTPEQRAEAMWLEMVVEHAALNEPLAVNFATEKIPGGDAAGLLVEAGPLRGAQCAPESAAGRTGK